MDRKSSVKDVHKFVDKDLPELYKSLCATLGEDNPFAKFSIGFGFYVWSDNRYQWHKMTEASDLDKSLIQDALNKTIERISSKIGSKTAEVLFTTPDDSYIYYNDDYGEVKILITGWGFKKPERINIGGDKNPYQKNTPVKLSFSFDGVKQPNYEFIIKLARQEKRLKTDANGSYVFSNLKGGKHFILKDIQSGKDFLFNDIEGQSEYDYDITTYANVSVVVLCDGKPLLNEPVKINIHGKEYTSITNGDGTSRIRVPRYRDEVLIATVRDKSQQEYLSAEDLKLIFEFEGEKVNTDIVVSVLINSQPQQYQDVTIHYAGQTYNGQTDGNGQFTQNVTVSDDETCTVEVNGFESQSKILTEESVNKFLFEKTEMPQPPVDDIKKLSPRIIVKRENGEIVTDYALSVEYNGITTQYTTNPEGCVYLNEMEEGKSMTVSNLPSREIEKNYVLDHKQEEYEFIIPKEEVPKKNIKVMFRDVKSNPIKCDNVVFQQKGKNNLLLNLDEQGNAYFEEETFKVAEPMSVRINGWNTSEAYTPISLTLDKGEYEYLIQEKPSKTSWRSRILEILFVLVSAVALFILWPYFEQFCRYMFDVIYK